MMDVTQGKERMPILGPEDVEPFQYVKTNVPGPGSDVSQFMEEFDGCSCADTCNQLRCPCFQIFGPVYDDNGRLLETWCLGGSNSNRSILECGDNCSCKNSQCCLRVVQKGIRSTLRVTEIASKGFGLFAGSEIKRFSFVCEYAGEVIDENEAKIRLNKNQSLNLMNYLIAVHERTSMSKNCWYIDPCNVGNIGRFINHSCDPNLIMIPVRVNHPVPRLALFARRDIDAVEELTFDYSGLTTFNYCDCDDDKDSQKLVSSAQPENGQMSNYPPLLSKMDPAEASSDFSCDPGVSRETNYVNCATANNKLTSPIVNEKTPRNCDGYSYRRTRCLCGSKNCSGFLPYDEYLFDDNDEDINK